MAQNLWQLGQTSEYYETGNRGPGTITHDPNDPGGASYGLPQFSVVEGSLQEYLAHSSYKNEFKGLKPGSSAFDAKWHEVAKNDPVGFAKEQREYTKAENYDKQNVRLREHGLDLSGRGPAVQDAIWSTSVQFKNMTPGIFGRGLEEKFGKNFDLSNLSDKDIVEAVQDYKVRHNAHLFPRVHSDRELASLENRARNEKADLLNLADGKVSNHAHHDDSSRANHSLDQNTHSQNVRQLQAELAALGYQDAHGHPLKADGVFGIETRHAVERFQQDHHLTVDGKVGPITAQALDAALSSHAQIPSLTDAKHPDHLLYQQAYNAVTRLDAQLGRTPDAHTSQLAGAVVVAAKENGLHRIDHVLLSEDGSRAFAVTDDLSKPDRQVAFVDTATAVHTPLTQSSQAAVSVRPPQQSSLPIQAPAQGHQSSPIMSV